MGWVVHTPPHHRITSTTTKDRTDPPLKCPPFSQEGYLSVAYCIRPCFFYGSGRCTVSSMQINSLSLPFHNKFPKQQQHYNFSNHSSLRKKSSHNQFFTTLHQKNPNLSQLILHYAENGQFLQSRTTFNKLLNTSSFVPSLQFISKLFSAYEKQGEFYELIYVLNSLKNLRNFTLLPRVYSLAISCFGRAGQLELMEETRKEMISKGFGMDSHTCNDFLLNYAVYGSLNEMEYAYGCFKRSRFLIEENVIRAMASMYIKERKFYELGEFLRDVGLGRKNVGNLLWNCLLLSYAANFKMKSLQREFVKMVEAGFRPDVTTFNIRAIAFSRMSLFWDLHLSIEHMVHEKVVPDLVTYGCVVDAYLDRRLGRNLDFALNKMNVDDSPRLLTDLFVFEALGKGDFHLSSEAFLEYKTQQKLSYKVLIQKYLKKHYRRNQIFWNY